MAVKKKAVLLILLILWIFSLTHFAHSGIFHATRIMPQLKGAFVSTFPSYWAWKFNPEFIKQNPSCVSFREGPEGKTWGYGPVEHFLTFPLIFLHSFQDALKIWFTFCFLLLGAAMYLWYKMLFLDNKLHSFTVLTIFVFLWFNYFPLYEGISTGVTEIFELFLLTLSFYLLSRKKEITSGILLGFAAMTKYLPLGFIPYFFLKKKYKLFITSLIIAGIMVLLAELTLGWKESFIFYALRLPWNEFEPYYALLAIPNAIYRLYSTDFGYYMDSKLIYPEAAILTSKIVICLIALFYTTIFIIKRKSGKTNYEIAILSILMISIIQHSETYYLIFLLIPFSIGLQYIFTAYQKTGKLPKFDILILFSSFLLIGGLIPFSILNKIFSYFSIDFLRFYLGFSLPVLGYLVLLIWVTVKYLTDRTILTKCEFIQSENKALDYK